MEGTVIIMQVVQDSVLLKVCHALEHGRDDIYVTERGFSAEAERFLKSKL